MKMKKMLGPVALLLLLAGCNVEGSFLFDGDDGVVVELVSIDSEDGYVDTEGIFLHDGILVESHFSTGFFSFPLHAIPPHAFISHAFLFIGVHSVFAPEDSLVIDIFQGSGIYAGSFEIFLSDEMSYVFLDVTDILIDALEGRGDRFQISLEARDGAVFLEDGGDNLGTGLVPFIEATYF
ncbi:MAG: hypothetical protein GTN70_07190 [Deltaproteobacteria bacterium]|nr:hypothetical protein [Deltaproteobacteria bacterium]NIS77480.1 hypothetical protein [Deltaproteobacteria bacterium]